MTNLILGGFKYFVTCSKFENTKLHAKKPPPDHSIRLHCYLWHFGCWFAHHFLLPDFLLDKNTGHVEGAQQNVGLKPQCVALRRQQLQGVQCWIQVVAATQVDKQVHQRLTEGGKKTENREKERK